MNLRCCLLAFERVGLGIFTFVMAVSAISLASGRFNRRMPAKSSATSTTPTLPSIKLMCPAH
jgi:hypothetical protein